MKRWIVMVLVAALLQGCSVREMALRSVGDALAGAYASDEDIELVGAATPFGLKTIESLLLRTPEAA